MPRYKYVAKDSKGDDAKGTIEAGNRSEAIEYLRKQKLVIISVEEEKGVFKLGAPSFRKRVKLDDMVIFSRQLATMIDAGVPLVGALDTLGQQIEKDSFKEVVLKVRDSVETGSSLSEAMAKYKSIFSPLFINMVRAGESSGMLDEIVDRVAVYMEKTGALQKKIKSALMYPTVVTVMALAITLFLIIRVIPVFKEIYSGFGAQLPKPTMALIALSEFLQKYFLLAVCGAVVFVFLAKKYINTPNGRLKFDGFLLKMPVFGQLFQKVAISKFTRTLSTLVRSGVPILASLDIVAKTAGNMVVEKAVEQARANVREGENIAEPLARSKIFPPMVIRMISVGERSGQLEKMLSKISDFYEQQVDTAVSGLTSMIEPLIIAFLGLVIGSIVICMFLPIFRITAIMGA